MRCSEPPVAHVTLYRNTSSTGSVQPGMISGASMLAPRPSTAICVNDRYRVHDLLARVDDHHQPHPGVEPIEYLILDIRIAIGGRDDLDDQIGGARPISFHLGLPRQALAGDEGDVGGTHRIGRGGQEETRLGGVPDAQALSPDRSVERCRDVHRDPAVPLSRGCHSGHLSPHKLVASAVVRHAQQLVGGDC